MIEIRLGNTWYPLTRGQVTKSIKSKKCYGMHGHSFLDSLVIHFLLHS
jgi:hypothetical protein